LKTTLAFLLVTVAVALAGYWLYGIFRVDVTRLATRIPPGLTLRNINYVKNVDGNPVWSLRVDQATRKEPSNILVGKGIRLLLYRKGEALLKVTSLHGEAEVKTGRMRIWGDVKVVDLSNNCTLSTQELTYLERQDVVQTDREATFRCRNLFARGQGLKLYIDRRHLTVRQHVTAEIE
jgi:LPS export ABC transporter protein LptC